MTILICSRMSCRSSRTPTMGDHLLLHFAFYKTLGAHVNIQYCTGVLEFDIRYSWCRPPSLLQCISTNKAVRWTNESTLHLTTHHVCDLDMPNFVSATLVTYFYYSCVNYLLHALHNFQLIFYKYCHSY